MAQELQLLSEELTLFQRDPEALTVQNRETCLEVLAVLGFAGGEHKNVIKVDEDAADLPEQLVHHPLECSTAVSQTQRHE